MQAFPLIMNFLIMPIFFLSGALFPLEGLPKAISIIAKINPLTYCVDGLRESLLGVSQFGIILDIGVVVAISLALTLMGSYFFSKIEL